MKTHPRIIVIGNTNSGGYPTPVEDSSMCRQAAQEIGEALAKRGCDLMIFSSDPEYIEYDVLRGYTAVKGKRHIILRFAEGSRTSSFPREWLKECDLSNEAERAADWEVGFFRALPTVDGLLLIGGGWFVFHAGLVALSHGLPVAPAATLGGGARQLWRNLDGTAASLLSEADVSHLCEPSWSHGSAESIVDLLVKQIRSRHKTEAAEKKKRSAYRRLSASIITVLSFAAAAALLTWGLALPVGASAWTYYSLLLGAPAMAGLAGGAANVLQKGLRGDGALRNYALGIFAGGISALAFVISQLVTNNSLLDTGTTEGSEQAKRLLVFAWMFGIIGGVTARRVLKKVRSVEIMRTDGLGQGTAATEETGMGELQ